MVETAADIITRLAEVQCPGGDGHYVGRPYNGTTKWEGCTACQGTGARFHWLRKDCSDCRSSLTGRPTGRVNPDWRNSPPCNLCHGQGWLPRVDIPLEEALAKLLVYERLQVLDHWRRPLWEADSTTAEDVRLAFWQAAEKMAVPPGEGDRRRFVSEPATERGWHRLRWGVKDRPSHYFIAELPESLCGRALWDEVGSDRVVAQRCKLCSQRLVERTRNLAGQAIVEVPHA